MAGVRRRHVETVESLPFHHLGPFDRILIATAVFEGMAIITQDANTQAYEARCVC